MIEFTIHETERRVKYDVMSGSLNPGIMEFESWDVEYDGIIMEFSNVED